MTDITKTRARPVTFSPEELQAVIAKATAEAVAQATASLKAEMQAALAAKRPPSDGKVSRSIENEVKTVKAFLKAGFKDAKPHVNILTFKKWLEKGYRPVEGSKSIRVANLRLFHQSQVRKITAEEKAAMQAQSDDAVARHTAKVIPMTEAGPQ